MLGNVDKEHKGVGFGMNTEITYKIFGGRSDKTAACVMKEIIRLENKLSRFVPKSEISRLNSSAGKAPVGISKETFRLLSYAMMYSEMSKGLFNVLSGPLIKLWDYKHATKSPEEMQIKQAMQLTSYHDLILDEKNQTAYLRKPGQSIDVGGIGKGYAGDCCVDRLKSKGIFSAFINIGGNVSVIGGKPDGSPWLVGIRHPRKSNSLLGVVEVSKKAVVTSGDYERYFIDSEGNRRHHIMNPLTGYPAASGLISVTVIADNGVAADALSTAIFVAGMDEGSSYLSRFPGVEAIMVNEFQQIFITRGLKQCFHSTGNKVNVI